MKITNSEVIKGGEQELIDAITADLDWGAIEDIFMKDHNLGIEEDIEYKRGDIVAHNNQIAYKLEFEVKVNLSILLNRQGDYISVAIIGEQDNTELKDEDEPSEEPVTEENESKQETDDSEGPIDTDEDLQTDTEPEPESIDKDNTEIEDEYKEALAELDSSDIPEDPDTSKPMSPDEGSGDKIAQMASRAGEILSKIGDKSESMADMT
ncbi:MAG: hypothetical protein JRC68_09575 [Deltaproteobacteria bacterium]|nr:hypothetical protein [Deltaproteobacteria bacterium]